MLLNIFVIRLTLQRSVLSLLPLSPLGWTMQTLSCTASPQNTSLACSVLKNTLARVVTPGSHLATLSKLHWLPVHDRIKFRIATMTHNDPAAILVTPHIWLIWFSGTRHAELYGLLLPTFSLLLVVTFHLALEVFAAPTIWNSLPFHVRSCETLTTFCRHLKSHFFHSALPTA